MGLSIGCVCSRTLMVSNGCPTAVTAMPPAGRRQRQVSATMRQPVPCAPIVRVRTGSYRACCCAALQPVCLLHRCLRRHPPTAAGQALLPATDAATAAARAGLPALWRLIGTICSASGRCQPAWRPAAAAARGQAHQAPTACACENVLGQLHQAFCVDLWLLCGSRRVRGRHACPLLLRQAGSAACGVLIFDVCLQIVEGSGAGSGASWRL